MSEAVRETTPIEIVERDLLNFFKSKDLVLNEEMDKHLHIILDRGKEYEHDFYNRQWEVKREQVKDLERQNKVLETQNRIITEYVMFLESK